MRAYRFASFGLEHLRLEDRPRPEPRPGEIRVALRAVSLNYRDLMVVTGAYNPRLPLPATPLSDGAGMVSAVGEGVTDVAVGDRVVSHFVSGWIDGPYRAAYVNTTLGLPAAGLAAEEVVLPAAAVLPVPEGYDFAEAATLPIAALTAWNALVTEGHLEAGQTVLTLGTGGVSIFALQMAKALGARVAITSASDEKLARCRALGADATVNYREHPAWDRKVREWTGGDGVDVVVENGGIGTLATSLRATRAGGTVAMLGALTGLAGETNLAPLLMMRIRIAGILVGSRAAFAEMNAFLVRHRIRPVIGDRFPFERLTDALAHLQAQKHFGKIVVEHR
ncbi:MAG: NAD(P)-dependent alcohol dehydrogenase [Planctomycetes bacterium]|nr:NAD(P)-dependent alcohol dehydrogenase [Planctomycetota bacterium]